MTSLLQAVAFDSWILHVLLWGPMAAMLHVLLEDEERSGHIAFGWTLALFVVSLGLWWSFTVGDPGFQMASSVPWIEAWGVHYALGIDGISLFMVLLSCFTAPDHHPRLVPLHHPPPEVLLRPHAPVADGHHRRLHGAGSDAVLRLLRTHPGADVLHRRRLGRQAAHLRRREVLPVHGGGVAADAGRDPLPLRRDRGRRRRILRLPGHPRRVALDARATLAVRRLRAGVLDQGAPVPLPHLAAGRARGSSHAGLGGAGRNPAQDGHLRVPAVPAAVLSGRLPASFGGDGDDGARHGGHRVRGLGGRRAAGRQEARGLHFGGAHGLRGDRHFRPDAERNSGRARGDDLAWHLHRGALPHPGHAVRASPHPADRGVRRPRTRRTHARPGPRDHRPGLHRPSRHKRLRRRVPGASGHLRDAPRHRRHRHQRRHLRRLLHAAHGAAGSLQRAGPGGEPVDARPLPPGDLHPVAHGRAHDRDRGRAHADSRAHGAERGSHPGARPHDPAPPRKRPTHDARLLHPGALPAGAASGDRALGLGDRGAAGRRLEGRRDLGAARRLGESGGSGDGGGARGGFRQRVAVRADTGAGKAR